MSTVKGGIDVDRYGHMSVVSSKHQVRKSLTVNRKLQIREIVIARSGTTKQSKFILVGLLHFVRNDMVFFVNR